jgi:phage terminase Nu1 subunit (DNA packaging protein)
MTVQSIEKTAPLRTANKSQAAAWFDVSLATIDAWIRRGAPCVERGAKGSAWVFDLRDLARWYFGKQSSPGAEGSIDPASMSPKERLDHYRALREQAKHQQEMGQLIPAIEFENGIASIVKPLANGIESLPDLLERDVGLTGAQVGRAIEVCDALRESLYRQLGGTDP